MPHLLQNILDPSGNSAVHVINAAFESVCVSFCCFLLFWSFCQRTVKSYHILVWYWWPGVIGSYLCHLIFYVSVSKEETSLWLEKGKNKNDLHLTVTLNVSWFYFLSSPILGDITILLLNELSMQHHWENLPSFCTLLFCPARSSVPIHNSGPAVFLLLCRTPLALSSFPSSASPHDSPLWAWWSHSGGIQTSDPGGRPRKTHSSSSGAAAHMSIATLAQVQNNSEHTPELFNIVMQ